MNLEDLASAGNRTSEIGWRVRQRNVRFPKATISPLAYAWAKIESLKEAGSRGAGVRVLIGKHTGSAYTSDLSDEGIATWCNSALELAKITTEDPYAGLPDSVRAGQDQRRPRAVFRLGCLNCLPVPRSSGRSGRRRLRWRPIRALSTRKARLAILTSVSTVFANSLGFLGSYRSSSCSISAVPVAKQNGSMERDFWFSVARSVDALENPEEVGRKAAERALRRLGARKVSTQKVPMIFEPRVARTLLDNIFDAVSGDSVYRGETFLAGKLGQKDCDPKS